MGIRFKAAVLTGLLITAPAWAATWEYLTTASDGTVYKYDSESLSRKGDYVTAWILSDFSKVASVKARSSKSKISINCADLTISERYYVENLADGSVLRTGGSDYAPYKPIVPDTVGETFAKVLCLAPKD